MDDNKYNEILIKLCFPPDIKKREDKIKDLYRYMIQVYSKYKNEINSQLNNYKNILHISRNNITISTNPDNPSLRIIIKALKAFMDTGIRDFDIIIENHNKNFASNKIPYKNEGKFFYYLHAMILLLKCDSYKDKKLSSFYIKQMKEHFNFNNKLVTLLNNTLLIPDPSSNEKLQKIVNNKMNDASTGGASEKNRLKRKEAQKTAKKAALDALGAKKSSPNRTKNTSSASEKNKLKRKEAQKRANKFIKKNSPKVLNFIKKSSPVIRDAAIKVLSASSKGGYSNNIAVKRQYKLGY